MALTKIPRGLLDTGIADSSDATAITIDSSENVTFAGNVGIGEPSPTAKLHITVADNTEFLKATITGQEHWAFKGASGSGATDYVSFGISGGTQAMAWQEDGKVGIGETTPLGNLHVKSADSGGSVDGGTDELVLEGSGNSGMTILSGASNTGSIYFGDSGSTWDGYIAYSHASREMTVAAAQGGNYIKLDTTGSVGFSSTPTAWGSGYKSIQIGDRGFVAAHTGSDLYIGQNAYHNSGWKYEASVAASLTQHSGGQITHYVTTAGTAGNAISWTTGLHINTSGYVGIGETSPDNKLHITGANWNNAHIKIERTDVGGANDAGLVFKSAAGAADDTALGSIWFQNALDSNAYAMIRARTDDSSGTSGRLEFMTSTSSVGNGTAAALTIDSYGNLEGATLWASTNEITSTMDNLKRTGFYRIQNNAGGQPISGNYGAACVFGNQGNVTTQIWSQLQTSNLYVRSFNNAWSSWTAL